MRGLRYRLRVGGDEVADALAGFGAGDDVSLRPDLDNATSRRVVLVTSSGIDLGWVPDLLADPVTLGRRCSKRVRPGDGNCRRNLTH